MIRVCPKCGDYYTGEEFTFCLADGTPLANVIPDSTAWTNGLRVVEEKRRVFKQTQRRLKLRRMFMTVTTVFMTMSILSVAAVNGWIYLKPVPDTAPTRSPVVSSSLPAPEPAPTGSLLPWPPRSLLVSPSPSPSPSHSPTPSPSPRRSATPLPVCSPEARDREFIIGVVQAKSLSEERSEYMGRPGHPAAEVTLSEFKTELKFNKTCNEVSATVSYLLRVVGPATPYTNSPRSRGFGCRKTGSSWICN